MKLAYMMVRKPYDIFLKIDCRTVVRPVRFYRGSIGQQKDPESRESSRNMLIKNFHKAKIIEVPFEAGGSEVTMGQLKHEGLISKPIHDSILNLGFTSLTPVQQKSIRPIVESMSQDVITRAKTGTGKTFAFLIPMFQYLINTKRENPSAVKHVIVAPTRDLAFQIEAETRRIQNSNPILRRFRSLTLVGGTNFASGITGLIRRKPQIIIATPGRLLDVLQRYENLFQRVSVKILDEADRLLEIGFQQDLEKISNILNRANENGPNHIRTLLFSATLDSKVRDLSQNIMGKSECLFLDTIDKNEPQAHEKISQSAVISKNLGNSVLAIMDHINCRIPDDPNYKAILFTPTIKFTTWISNLLGNQRSINLPILEFHGKKQQNVRTKMVQNFKRSSSAILVCTDVAARGLDFPDVNEVLQLGVPAAMPQYIHRIGRTARAGKTGKAIIFISESEIPFLRRLEKETNIVIRDQQNYVPDMHEVEQFPARLTDKNELVTALVSAIAYYRSNARNYGFKDNKILRQIADSYSTLLNDKKMKLPISSSTLQKLGLGDDVVILDALNIQKSSYGNGDTQNRENGRNPHTYRPFGEKNWYDEEPFQNFMKRGKLKNRVNFKSKFYDRRKSHNPRLVK